MKKIVKTCLNKKVLAAAALVGATYKYRHKLKGALASSLVLASPMIAEAAISEQSVYAYANSIKTAANTRNIGQIARLISDDAIISLSRQGRGTTTLSKSDYLQLLQKGWTNSSTYRFDIEVRDVLITGDQARAQIITTETWTQNGKPMTIMTSSRATLGLSGKNTVLLRSVSQVTVN